jgi:NAD(P)-dependent dehydrogenase (short-subunit alcohol dehydrogenase family)
MKFEGIRAIITGGVSGLGFGVAEHFAAHGAKVTLFDVNEEAAETGSGRAGAGPCALLRRST